ncbi:putative Ribonuclease T2-like protein [Glarea lozoyensis 74030]|uniref:Ribonuclease T2-like n=1 Tax=Glarea lozoyensis (strain ATCC 74030 / MF5533) TaxID=1104152 RepID=H0EEG1_GLAL7|nr:putative Ribonuclease T2-like protein [Glarea lozoyensis 74030]
MRFSTVAASLALPGSGVLCYIHDGGSNGDECDSVVRGCGLWGRCCGQLLQTQFWDTAPSTGPADSWTLHGLWPDHCDGTTDLLTYMSKYWKDYQGNDESFWEHEWDKHGTCISTLEPSCYNGYTGQEEVVDYFEKAVSLFQGLDSYKFLAAAGILPSTTVTYTSAQIQSALTAAHGFPVTIGCSGGALDEIWYHFDVRGSVQTGEFVATSPDGSKSSCADTGVKYLPKYLPPSTTTTSSPPGPTATGAPYAGKGFLQATTGGAQKGCLISAGTWYTTGTCATYTATASGNSPYSTISLLN